MATTFHEKPKTVPVCPCGQDCEWSTGGFWMSVCRQCRHALWVTFQQVMAEGN